MHTHSTSGARDPRSAKEGTFAHGKMTDESSGQFLRSTQECGLLGTPVHQGRRSSSSRLTCEQSCNAAALNVMSCGSTTQAMPFVSRGTLGLDAWHTGER